jgi:hypothetical protein
MAEQVSQLAKIETEAKSPGQKPGFFFLSTNNQQPAANNCL